MEEKLELLLEKINEAQNELDGLPVGSEEYERASQSLERLWKVYLAHEKNVIDASQADINESVEMTKIKDAKEARKWDAIIKIAGQGALRVVEVGLIGWIQYKIFRKGIEFEKDGSITSTTVRNFFPKIKF